MGVGQRLFLLPLFAVAGYGASALLPALALVATVKVVENSTDYSLQNTIQQALFLPTSRDAKYKAKAAIDTFSVRLGDLGLDGAGVRRRAHRPARPRLRDGERRRRRGVGRPGVDAAAAARVLAGVGAHGAASAPPRCRRGVPVASCGRPTGDSAPRPPPGAGRDRGGHRRREGGAAVPAGEWRRDARWFADRPVAWDEHDDALASLPATQRLPGPRVTLAVRDGVANEVDRVLALEDPRAALDVNALDEVPCSTWFCPRNHLPP